MGSSVTRANVVVRNDGSLDDLEHELSRFLATIET